MLFNIEIDEGTRIVGYLVPDSYSASGALRISDGERELAVLPCREERPSLVVGRRHETGHCGFTIDEKVIADLPRRERLELYDAETGLLIYRRRPPAEAAQKRIFRLETHLFPLWRLDDGLERHFQFFYRGIERYGRETTTQLFLLNHSGSLYMSGRLIFKAYDNYINETFNCVALLRDPYLELAERLLTLKHVRGVGKEILGERDLMAFAPAIAFAEGIESDEKVLHRAFAAMSPAAIALFANPLTRQLAARTPEEVPGKGAIATALATLSSFAILGLREHQDLFRAALADLAGVPADRLASVPDFAKTAELSRLLRDVPEAGLLIEQDLEVYHHVRSAIAGALADETC